MATGDDSGAKEGGGKETNLLPELEVSLTQGTIEEWKETAVECVRNEMFNKKQFLVNDRELDMGGTIQKLIARKLNITNHKRMSIFWEEGGGRGTVRNSFRKKGSRLKME